MNDLNGTTAAGRRVLVFGGTSGIGAAAARAFVDVGASVTVVGRDTTKATLLGKRLGVDVLLADARDRDALDQLFAGFGRFDDLVVTLSGGGGGGTFRELDLDALRRGMNDKLFAQLTVIQSALPHLGPDGSITLVTAASSRAALRGTAGLAAINGALDAMVPVLAVELAPIRVNAISPGVIDSPWWDRFGDSRSSMLSASADASLFQRAGTSAEVAHLIVAVARATFVTGSVVAVDGGIALAMGRPRAEVGP